MRVKSFTPLVGMLLFIGAFFALAGGAEAAWSTKEQPLNDAGDKFSQAISTFAFTATPSSSSLADRRGIKVRNPSTNNASVICTCDDTGSTPTGITVADIEIQTGENPFLECGPNLTLYCVSLHTSAETINGREYK